jgi:RimJ/RimL family protein N-acetyltransferase
LELVTCTEDDAWLTVALETDPRVMAELGGPWTPEKALATHARRIRGIADSGNWMFKVVPEQGSEAVGTIMVWASEHEGEPISEAGWMILPEHQGRGHATAALAALLERTRHDPRWGDIHAFPGATNAASNALCRKSGFEELGSHTVDYAGRILRVNHWVWRVPVDRAPFG